MRTYTLNQARAAFSKLIDRALAGDPQRVTRYGKGAVVIVSEETWRSLHHRSTPTLGALIAKHARAGLFAEPITARSWSEWPLRRDIA